MLMLVKVELSQEATDKLMEIALAERRPLRWQLEVLLEQAIARWHTPILQANSCPESFTRDG
jgi:hypothetical protein